MKNSKSSIDFENFKVVFKKLSLLQPFEISTLTAHKIVSFAAKEFKF